MLKQLGKPSPKAWKLGVLALGIVLGAALHRPIEKLGQKLQDYRCGTQAILREADRLREEAVQIERDAGRLGIPSHAEGIALPKHQNANALYERAAKCGSVDALVQLAIAHCSGYGLPVAKTKGLELISDASMGTPAINVRQAADICLDRRGGPLRSFQLRSWLSIADAHP